MDIPAQYTRIIDNFFSSLNNPYIVSHVPVIFSQVLVPLAVRFFL